MEVLGMMCGKQFVRVISLLVAVLILLVCKSGYSATFYVGAGGDDSNPGTKEKAFSSIKKAIEVAAAGDSILIRGGTYALTKRIDLDKSGSKGKLIKLWANSGEEVILDFSNGPRSSDGLKIEGSYWHIKGLTIQNVGEKGIRVSGSGNIIENTVMRKNGDCGIKIDDGGANNLVLNCDSYLNYDKAMQGSNADGFAAKHGLGKGNVFRGCRAWNNSDDGFDFMEAGNAVHVEDCWSWGNGQNIWKDEGFDGNGVGFKLGDGPGEHYITRCLVWGNAKSGFNIQGNTSRVQLYNNTAWDNQRNYFFDDDHPHKLRNNVSLEGEVVMWDGIDHAQNSWNGGFEVTRDDFVSLDDSGMKGLRKADNSFPESNFLRLAACSDLVDGGTVDGSRYFCGLAPDMGALESCSGADLEDKEVIGLWPGQGPSRVMLDKDAIDQAVASNCADHIPAASLTYFPAKNPNGTTVVVCPGGGYRMVCYGKEGIIIARWLNSLGISAFVLKYRLPAEGHIHPVPLQDAQRAIRYVRSNAGKYGIDADRIGIMGFSAGGHLASTAGTHFDYGKKSAKEAIDRVSSRPDFMVLVYPVVTFDEAHAHMGSRNNLLGDQSNDAVMVKYLSNELQVTKETPPTFLAHAKNDVKVPFANSVLFHEACLKSGVPSELGLYEQGGHGFKLGRVGTDSKRWIKECEEWLGGLGLIK
jgi:acetyl esterase/lipase